MDYEINAAVLNELLLAPRPELELEAAWSDLSRVLPELAALDMDQGGARLHKDNVAHTIAVMAKTPARLRVRLLALFHDVGKPPTRRIEGSVVTFHQHEQVGGPLATHALLRLGYDRDLAKEVGRLVSLSGSTKGSQLWTDGAVRRFVAEAGELLDDLLDFVAVDVTSRHEHKHREVAAEVAALRVRIDEVRCRDEARAWRPVVSGDELMARYELSPSPLLGQLLARVSAAQKAAEAKGLSYSKEQAFELLDAELGCPRSA